MISSPKTHGSLACTSFWPRLVSLEHVLEHVQFRLQKPCNAVPPGRSLFVVEAIEGPGENEYPPIQKLAKTCACLAVCLWNMVETKQSRDQVKTMLQKDMQNMCMPASYYPTVLSSFR